MTLYEKTLLDNVTRALTCLGQGALATAGRLAADEVEVFSIYGMTGADRSSWVVPLVRICHGIGMMMDEEEGGARAFNTLTVWTHIMKQFSKFVEAHGDEADV